MRVEPSRVPERRHQRPIRKGVSGRVLVAWHRLGPYHHARLRAAAARMDVVGLEMSNVDRVYAWQPVAAAGGFTQRTLLRDVPLEHVSGAELRRRISDCLSEVRPVAVAVHGWAACDALILLDETRRHGIPAILMSDSNAFDRDRSWLREQLKARIVRQFAAALCGGTSSAEYVRTLGMPRERVFIGYDVVDNIHFARGAAAARADPARSRRSIGFEEPYFLACARFTSKKNLHGLLVAYQRYRHVAGASAWKLVILGDGELRPALSDQVQMLGIADAVVLPGFKQYDELPVWFGLASCFVHASTVEQWGLVVNEAMAAGLPVLVSERCGCAADLVRDGANGFTFNPHDDRRLAELMTRIAHGAVDRSAMGEAARGTIEGWSPERFAGGLEQAVSAAISSSPPKAGLVDRGLLAMVGGL